MKLTEVQQRVLKQIAYCNERNLTAWMLGTRTCEALRKRGLIEGNYPFTGCHRNDPVLRITDAGRAALRSET